MSDFCSVPEEERRRWPAIVKALRRRNGQKSPYRKPAGQICPTSSSKILESQPDCLRDFFLELEQICSRLNKPYIQKQPLKEPDDMPTERIIAFNILLRVTLFFVAMISTGFVLSDNAAAQNFAAPFAGMRNSSEPVHVEADQLEVQDAKGFALLSGNVSVSQGSTTIRARKMRVEYGRGSSSASAAGNIKKITATGGIAVRSGNQKATADSAIVDMKAQIATLSGNVVISVGKTIVRGKKLVVNLKTNAAHFDGRPSMVFSPSNN